MQRNLVRGVLTSPKSHQRRRVDMSPQLVDRAARRGAALQRARWLKKGKPMPQWVFPVARRARRSRSATSVTCSRGMLEKAELRQIRIHDLRHTFASLLLQQGAPIVYVKEQLGHGTHSDHAAASTGI